MITINFETNNGKKIEVSGIHKERVEYPASDNSGGYFHPAEFTIDTIAINEMPIPIRLWKLIDFYKLENICLKNI